MKFSPYTVIGLSAIVAIIVLLAYYYQTSPKVTDIEPETATLGEQIPEAGKVELVPPELGITAATIAPDGSAVISGNAPAGSTINLHDRKTGELVGTATATGSGEWVINPDTPLDEGSHLLTAEIIAPDGTTTVGPHALAVEIPEGKNETPLVVLVPYTEEALAKAETKILQTPEKPVKRSTGPRLTIRTIQGLNQSLMSVSGMARGGTMVTLSLNGVETEPIRPDGEGAYTVKVPVNPFDGTLKLKGVLRNSKGKQVATARITLTRSQVRESLGQGNPLIVIQKGDALWRIAYRTYGEGTRYIDIYLQNRSSINDPDLIYPDQIFLIPKE
jgi:hypothetical protein